MRFNRSAVCLTVPFLAPTLGLATALFLSACAAEDSVGLMLRADAEAILADKTQIDLDTKTGNAAALVHDRHQLYLDTEKQEHDRGTEDDELAEGEW